MKSFFGSILNKKNTKVAISAPAETSLLSTYSATTEEILPANEIIVIPQFNGTCWFNVILMAMLYSQGLRSFVYKEASLWTLYEPHLKNNKFKRILLFILKYNYSKPDKIRQLFKKRVKPEFLLYSYLDYYHLNDESSYFYKQLMSQLNKVFYGFYSHFMNEFFLNIFRNESNYLAIYYIDGDVYLGKRKKTLKEMGFDKRSLNPKILILYHEDFFPSTTLVTSHFSFITGMNLENAYLLTTEHKNKGISNYKNEITFNGHKYKLDCCIINNYNKSTLNIGHGILGLTYNNRNYVYNGWTANGYATVTNEYNEMNREPCKLFEHDWKSDLYAIQGTRGFCISKTHCDGLDDLNEEDLCFDFSQKNDEKIFIYVKEDERLLPSTNLITLVSSSLSPRNLHYSSSSIEKFIDKYHKLRKKDLNELIEILSTNIEGYTRNIILLLLDKIENYKILFFILCKRKLNTSSLDEEAKFLLIALIELYLKEDRSLYIAALNDDIIYQSITIETIEKMLENIGYGQLSLLTEGNLFMSYHILYRIITSTYQPYFLQSKPYIQKKLFVFLLIKAFIIDNYIFSLHLYTDEGIIMTAIRNEDKLTFIFDKLKTIGSDNHKYFQYLWSKYKTLLDDESNYKILRAIHDKIEKELTKLGIYKSDKELFEKAKIISATLYSINIKALEFLMK